MPDGPEIINSQEAARILGLSVRSLQRKANTGTIPIISKGLGNRTEYAFDAAVIEEIAHHTS